MTVSEWAERYRYMSSLETSRPGPWRNDVVPYLKDIMDTFNRDGVEKIIFLKPTQVGGTECGINILGYVLSEKPNRIIYVLPDDNTMQEFSADRLQKVLESNECFEGKYKAGDSKNTMLRFAGGFCKFGSANSPMDLASWSVPIVIMDEIDKYKRKSGNEASPLKLAEERTKNWPGKRKLYFWSTPTTKTGHIWSLYESADVHYEYQVPCPHCGRMQPLKWDQVKFDAEKPTAYIATHSHYECMYCHGVVKDFHKPEMLKKGKWVPLEDVENPKSVAYALNSLYSPWVSFGQMAEQFMLSKDKPLELMNFVNSWLGEPWESKSAVMEAGIVAQHKTDCPMFVVPEWAQLLTGGVDVQKGHMYWQITAWGAGTTGQVLGYGRCLTWDDLEEVMERTTYYSADKNAQYRVCIYGIDSRYRTTEVYDYCWKHQGIAFPIEGATTRNMPNYLKVKHIEPKSPGKMALQLWEINTKLYKDEIAMRLEIPVGRSSWMLNADCSLEFCEHLTSEHRILDEKGHEYWEKKTSAKQNHWWDCCVYAFAMADLVNMRSISDPMLDQYKYEPEQSAGLESLPDPGFSL